MSHPPAKRSAHFEEDRDTTKKAKKSDPSKFRDQRDQQRDRFRDRDQPQQRRSRSPSKENPRRDGNRDRGPRDRVREEKEKEIDRRTDVRPPSSNHGYENDRSSRRDRSPARNDRTTNIALDNRKHEPSRRDRPRAQSPDRGSAASSTKTSATPMTASAKDQVKDKAVKDTTIKDKVVNGKPKAKVIDELEEWVDPEVERVMGFKKFKSTKNTKVPGNDKNYGIRREKKTEYRQYMNRQGGFNRPLSPSSVSKF